MANDMHPCPQKEEISVAVARFAKKRPQRVLPLLTLAENFAIDYDHGQRKQPALIFDLNAAVDADFSELQKSLTAIEGHIEVHPSFPFSGIVKVEGEGAGGPPSHAAEANKMKGGGESSAAM
jgi:hypothetical protein